MSILGNKLEKVIAGRQHDFGTLHGMGLQISVDEEAPLGVEITTANRQVTVNQNLTLTASFKEQTQSGGSGDDEGGVGEY